MRLLLRKPVVPLASSALLGTHSLRGALRSLYRLDKRTTKAASGSDVKLADREFCRKHLSPSFLLHYLPPALGFLTLQAPHLLVHI
jgi:hypothetical protein